MHTSHHRSRSRAWTVDTQPCWPWSLRPLGLSNDGSVQEPRLPNWPLSTVGSDAWRTGRPQTQGSPCELAAFGDPSRVDALQSRCVPLAFILRQMVRFWHKADVKLRPAIASGNSTAKLRGRAPRSQEKHLHWAGNIGRTMHHRPKPFATWNNRFPRLHLACCCSAPGEAAGARTGSRVWHSAACCIWLVFRLLTVESDCRWEGTERSNFRSGPTAYTVLVSRVPLLKFHFMHITDLTLPSKESNRHYNDMANIYSTSPQAGLCISEI